MARADIPKNTVKDYNGTTGRLDKEYGEIGDIRQDIDSLKENVKSLSKHLQKDGMAKADEVKSALNDGLDVLLSKGDKSFQAIEAQVRDNPRRSLMMAFLAGFALNLMMRRG